MNRIDARGPAAGLFAAASLAACSPQLPDMQQHEITKPDWARKPTSAEFARFYPKDAYNGGVVGRVLMRCQVMPQGVLVSCAVESEWPVGAEFGEAALSLAPFFRMKSSIQDGAKVASGVRIPIAFSLDADRAPSTPFRWRPGDNASAVSVEPRRKDGPPSVCGEAAGADKICLAHGIQWVARPDDAAAAATLAAFPDTVGVTTLICRPNAAVLTNCEAVDANDKPAAPAVRAALVSYAKAFRLPEKANDGAPIAGSRIFVAFPWKIWRANAAAGHLPTGAPK